jgi:hypothetical protein
MSDIDSSVISQKGLICLGQSLTFLPRQLISRSTNGRIQTLDIRIMSQVLYNVLTSGLYYKPMMIVNDDSRVVNKLEASLTDNARVVIYNRHMFI